MLTFLRNYLNKFFVQKEEHEKLKGLCEDLRFQIFTVQSVNAELHHAVKKQSEILNALAGVQSDIIGVFVSTDPETSQTFASSQEPAESLQQLFLFPGDDDDLIN
jgi:hypothetical protein|tara:strand:+ start:685 stop:999 length:315 start_codon:yes stop_codon:yes gene_type:complete